MQKFSVGVRGVKTSSEKGVIEYSLCECLCWEERMKFLKKNSLKKIVMEKLQNIR